MRKDLRVGLGIGGVLLAVLVVALIVRSHGKDKTKIAKAGTDTAGQIDSADGGEPAPPGGDGTAPQNPPDSTAAAPGDGPKNTDPFDPEGATGSPGRSGGASAAGNTTPGGTPATAGGGSPDDWEKILNASSPGPVRSMTPQPGSTNGRPGRANRGDKTSIPPGLVATGRGNGMDGGAAGTPGSANGAEAQPASSGGGGRAAAPGTPRTHVIKSGETFTSIARTVYGDGRYYLQILKANPGLEPSALKPGTRINLPELGSAAAGAGESRTNGRSARNAQSGANASGGSATVSIDHKTQYKVESGDSLYKIAEKLYGDGTRMDALYEANKQAIGSDPRKLKLGMILKLPEQPTVAAASR